MSTVTVLLLTWLVVIPVALIAAADLRHRIACRRRTRRLQAAQHLLSSPPPLLMAFPERPVRARRTTGVASGPARVRAKN